MVKDIIIIAIAYLIIAFIFYKGAFRLETSKAKFSSFKIFTFLVAIGIIADFIWGPFLINKNLTIEDRQEMEQAIAITNIFGIFIIFLMSALFTLTINMEFPMIFVIRKKNGQAVITEKRILRKSKNCILDMNEVDFYFEDIKHFNSIFLKKIRVRVHFFDDFLINQYKMVFDADIVPGTTLSIEKNRPVVYKTISDLLLRDIILKNAEDLQNGSAKELEKHPLHNSNFLSSWDSHGIQASSVKDIKLSTYPKLQTEEIVLK